MPSRVAKRKGEHLASDSSIDSNSRKLILDQKWLTMENGLKRLDANELKSWIEHYRDTMPGTPLIWLRDLVARINHKLQDIPDRDPTFHGYPVDYPLNLLKADVKVVLENTIKTTDHGTLEHIFEHCVQCIINHTQCGESSFGYRLVVQILASVHPDVTLTSLSKYLELMKHNQTKQELCLAVMWATGQCGYKDLYCGLRVWLAVMVPTLGLPVMSDYAVWYITYLFEMHGDVRSAYSSITFRDYFPILDIIMSGSSALSGYNQRKLAHLYPKMKEIAFGEQSDGKLKNFFPSFLARIKTSTSDTFTHELLSCLAACLERDIDCFNVWEKMYTTHIEQSSIFINYLAKNWETLSKRIDKTRLQKTLNKLRAFKGYEVAGYQKFIEACQNLKNEMNKKVESNESEESTKTHSQDSRKTSVRVIIIAVFIGVIIGCLFYVGYKSLPEEKGWMEHAFSGFKGYFHDKVYGPQRLTYYEMMTNKLRTTGVITKGVLDQIFEWSGTYLWILGDMLSVWLSVLFSYIDIMFQKIMTSVFLFVTEMVPNAADASMEFLHPYYLRLCDSAISAVEYLKPYCIEALNYTYSILQYLLHKLEILFTWLLPQLDLAFQSLLQFMDVMNEQISVAWSVTRDKASNIHDYINIQWKNFWDLIVKP
ncbi:transmembrane protein 214-like [Tubulanus polymorphus]|uniref:transmembrane protein 214-like n=1 Tax=Tubulanus polymorphus TaxID=672921 RepID=UPI003DA4163B